MNHKLGPLLSHPVTNGSLLSEIQLIPRGDKKILDPSQPQSANNRRSNETQVTSDPDACCPWNHSASRGQTVDRQRDLLQARSFYPTIGDSTNRRHEIKLAARWAQQFFVEAIGTRR